MATNDEGIISEYIENDEPRPKRNILLEYYGLETSNNRSLEDPDYTTINENNHERSNGERVESDSPEFRAVNEIHDPLDINGPYFVSGKYLDKMLCECNLNELDQQNNKISQQVRKLDSEIQTLVYDNYNKFISATDTIRQMRQDFKDMEQEIDKLDGRMQQINQISSQIDSALSPHKAKINKLSSIHELLRKLQFLYDLPGRLQKCLEMSQFALAVRYHLRALPILERYRNTPAFASIHLECTNVMQKMTDKLKSILMEESPFSDVSEESIKLLLKLGEPPNDIINIFMLAGERCASDYAKEMDLLNDSVEMFVDSACKGLLTILHDFSVKFYELFSDVTERKTLIDDDILKSFIAKHVEAYVNNAENFLTNQVPSVDPVVLVRALDTLYRKLCEVAPAKVGELLVSKIALSMLNLYRERTQHYFDSLLDEMQEKIVSSNKLNSPGLIELPPLMEIYTILHSSFLNTFKKNLIALKEFISPSIKFSYSPHFREQFCSEGVKSGLVKEMFEYVLDTSYNFLKKATHLDQNPESLVVLTKFCLHLEKSTISFLSSHADELFPLKLNEQVTLSPVHEICQKARFVAQSLIDSYVSRNGDMIVHLFNRSLVTRDWLNSPEPRNVRGVMKRIVEELTMMDAMTGLLFEEGSARESSDSSKRTYSQVSLFNIHGPSDKLQPMAIGSGG